MRRNGLSHRAEAGQGLAAVATLALSLAFAIILAGMYAPPSQAGDVGSRLATTSHAGGALADRDAVEQRFDEGLAAFDHGDYATAYEAWLPLARDGDPAAQRNVAHLFRHGLGVAQDFRTAAEWYRRAAESGLGAAQANLAMMYLRGQGVPEDAPEAARWFTLAALQGHAIAQYNLGLMYARGQGVERNEAIAAGWFYRAGQAGHQQAMRALARLVPQLSGPQGPPIPSGAALASTATATEAESTDQASSVSTPEAETSAKTPARTPAENTRPVAQPEAPAVATANQKTGPKVETLTERIRRWLSFEDDSPHPEEAQVAAVDDPLEPTPAPVPTPTASEDIAAATIAEHAGNFAVARRRLQPHAGSGIADAQYRLGRLLLNTEYKDGNPVDGYYWILRAIDRGHQAARESRSELAAPLTRGDIAEAEKRLFRWQQERFHDQRPEVR